MNTLIDCKACHAASMKDWWIKGASRFTVCKTCSANLKHTRGEVVEYSPGTFETEYIKMPDSTYAVEISNNRLGETFQSLDEAKAAVREFTRFI